MQAIRDTLINLDHLSFTHSWIKGMDGKGVAKLSERINAGLLDFGAHRFLDVVRTSSLYSSFSLILLHSLLAEALAFYPTC